MPYLRRPINFQLIALFIFHTHMFNFIATGLANTFLEHGNVRPIEKKKKKTEQSDLGAQRRALRIYN